MTSSDDLSGLICGVCCDHYHPGTRDPLTLPCGHTFCRSCLKQVEEQQFLGFNCPTCRSPQTTLSIAKNPPNYAMLSLLDSCKNLVLPEQCEVHEGQDRVYWCQPCETLVCGLCICQSHRQEHHTIVPAAEARIERREQNRQEMAELSRKVEVGFKENLRDAFMGLMHLTINTSELTNLKNTLDHIKVMNDSTVDMEDLVACQQKLQGMNPIAENTSKPLQQTLFSSSLESSLQHSPMSSAASPRMSDISSRSSESSYNDSVSCQTSTLADHFPELIRTQRIREVECHVRYREGRLGKLVGEGDDKLALHAFSGQILAGHFTLDWPVFSSHVPLTNCRVFLDISTIEQENLGRVTIRLRDNLRRARHFLGLCLGIWGPSYKKSTFFKVQDTEFCQFVVSGGHRDESTGLASTSGLMDDLEWDGDFAGLDRVGQVVSFGGGRLNLESVFGICIAEKVKGGRSRCPFADIEEGLEVVRKAATLMLSSAVMISQCGVIVSIGKNSSRDVAGSENLTQ